MVFVFELCLYMGFLLSNFSQPQLSFYFRAVHILLYIILKNSKLSPLQLTPVTGSLKEKNSH